MVWSLLGSGHGKGKYDGAGAIAKQASRKEQGEFDGTPLRNAEESAAYLRIIFTKEQLSHLLVRENVQRVIWEVKRGSCLSQPALRMSNHRRF